MLQDVPVPEDNFDSWACQVTARERSWEHMRRKRRLAQQIALKRAKGEDGECIQANICAEETSIKIENSTKKPYEESSDKELPDKNVPLLVCKFWVEAENPDDSQDVIVQSNKIFRIWMIFENGYGGLDALHSLRQYLINKLGIRKKILDNPSKFKRKKKKSKRTKELLLQSQLGSRKDLVNNEQDAENSEDS